MFKSPFFWSDYQPDRMPSKRNLRPGIVFGWIWKTLAGLLLSTILLTLILRWAPPPTSAFMLRSRVSRATIQYHWVPWHRISRHLPIAVVAAEDQKFPRHWGFDFDAINQALEENKQRARPRGASTITQQVAKNLFLWSGRSYIRKGLEAYFTAMIELLWTKRRILEVYLNIAEFGPGVFGVEAAGRVYFNKSADQLQKGDAALLAAVLPNPRKLKVAGPTEYVRQRASQIEGQMEHLGGSAYLEKIMPQGKSN